MKNPITYTAIILFLQIITITNLNSQDNKEKYQIVVVLEPKLEEKSVTAVMEKVSSWLEENGAEIVKKEQLGIKELVYPIKKFNKANFWELEVSFEKTAKFREFNLLLDREAKIIRYLILKI